MRQRVDRVWYLLVSGQGSRAFGCGGTDGTPNGECWRLAAPAANLSLEESIYLAHLSGPMRSIQIVLRGIATGDTEVAWRLERVKASDQRYRRGENRGATKL